MSPLKAQQPHQTTSLPQSPPSNKRPKNSFKKLFTSSRLSVQEEQDLCQKIDSLVHHQSGYRERFMERLREQHKAKMGKYHRKMEKCGFTMGVGKGR